MLKIHPQLIQRALQIYADVISFKSTTIGELDFLREQLSRLEPVLTPQAPVPVVAQKDVKAPAKEVVKEAVPVKGEEEVSRTKTPLSAFVAK